MFRHSWQISLQDLLIVILKSREFRESGHEEPCKHLQFPPPAMQYATMHGESWIDHERMQTPERVLLVHIHEQERRDLTHALAIAHFRVVHRVRGEHVE